MKKNISRISLLLLLFAVSFSSVAIAQRRGRVYTGRRGAPSHYHYRGDGFSRAVHDVDAVATGALAMYALGSLDDYTGIRLGLNAATLRTDLAGADENNKIGANVGLVFGWYLGNTPFIFEPGVFYAYKGGKYNYEGLSVEHSMHMIEFPIVLKYDIPLAPGYASLQPFAGFFLSEGFAGKTTFSDDREKYDTFDDGYLQSFDGGFRFGCGLNIERFYFEFAYDLGISDLAHDYDIDYRRPELNSRTMTFNIGFNF